MLAIASDIDRVIFMSVRRGRVTFASNNAKLSMGKLLTFKAFRQMSSGLRIILPVGDCNLFFVLLLFTLLFTLLLFSVISCCCSCLVSTDACKLNCNVVGTGAYYLLKQKVIDGTPCTPDAHDICVNGRCMSAGCDHVLGSNKQPDSCGVCGGNNSTCKLIKGQFLQTPLLYGYNSVTMLPPNSTNVDIHQFGQTKDDNSYLALRDDTGHYILNGDLVVSMFRKTIQYGGTTLEYSGSNTAAERINATKPMSRTLYVEVLSVGNLIYPNVTYQYTMSLGLNTVDVESPKQTGAWDKSEWDEVS